MISLSTYRKPVLLVGNGVRSAGAAELVYKVSAKYHIPVLTTLNAVDLVQDSEHIGFIGVYGNRVANTILSECDLLISVGARLGLRQIGNIPGKFAPKAKLVRVDIDENELSRVVKVDEEKHLLDAKEFLEILLCESPCSFSEWKNKCFKIKSILDKYDKEIGNLVIEKISSLMPENPIVAIDVGQNQCWCAQSLVLKGSHGRILIGGGYGAMGCGLPFAIGASIANKNGITYCITGDGGLQMNIQELETVVREKLPIKILVLNNYSLGKISEVQTVSYNSRYAQTTKESGYSVPDFEKIANAYGIKSATLSSYSDLDKYSNWLTDSDSCLLNITLPTDTKLIPKVKWETGDILPKIDDNVVKEISEILN